MSRRYIVGELGWCMAHLIVDEGVVEALTIMSPATCDEFYAPAESVRLNGRANILKLKEFLDTHVNAEEVKP